MKKHIGHPARKTRKVKMREHKERYSQPDATEKRVQDTNARMRRALHEGGEGDGLVMGPLMVAAEAIVDELLKQYDLDESHRLPVMHYLVGVWGETIHGFPNSMDILGYHAWREVSRTKVLDAVSN